MHRELIFADNLLALKKKVDLTRSGIRFIRLTDSKEMQEFGAFLNRETDFEEIDRSGVFRDKGRRFRGDYINFLGRLNVENAGFNWWIHDFTSKNLLVNDLGYNVFYCRLIADLLEEDSQSSLLILSEDADLRKQLRIWAKKTGIVKFVEVVKKKVDTRDIALWLPLYPFFYFIRTALRMLITHRKLRFASGHRSYTIIATLINHQSFDRSGRYRDTYFGELDDFLTSRDEAVLTFGKILNRYRENIEAVKSSGRTDVVPIEYFLSWVGLVTCLRKTLTSFFSVPRLKSDTLFNGFDVNYLIRRRMRRDYSRAYFTNLLFFYSAKALAKMVKIKLFLYPFENRAFEKMYLMAMRGHEPAPRLIGYNHAAVTPKHIHLAIMPQELAVLPLPDRIITLGEATKEILTGPGNFPEGLVKVGCGLRQPLASRPRLRPRPSRIASLLVVLTGELADYVNILIFLNEAFKDGSGDIHLLIRPHPILPLEKALERLPTLNFVYDDIHSLTLQESLDRAQAVLYTSSTVGIEALVQGLPVVYLDFGDIISADPLSNLNEFKWVVDDPADLSRTLERINWLSDDEYGRRQKSGADFANAYIYPASEENLARFHRLASDDES